MCTVKPLDSFNLPLNQVTLIEASAGTGKTFTMVNLYLRLILGVGNGVSRPLSVEEILVVTFTKAATAELKDRIRQAIRDTRRLFNKILVTQAVENEPSFANNAFLKSVFNEVKPNLKEAISRLVIAEQSIDLASIFTIDSFFQKMLNRFAFDSGIRFDVELQSDERELITRLTQEVWRERFYGLDFIPTKLVSNLLKTPQNIQKELKDFIVGELPELDSQQEMVNQDFQEIVNNLIEINTAAREYWRENGQEIVALLRAELDKPKGEKVLSETTYKAEYLDKWLIEMDNWSNSDQLYFPEKFDRFCQEKLITSTLKGKTPPEHHHFAKQQQFLTAYNQQSANQLKPILCYQFMQALREKMALYKQTHKTRSFNDMLYALNNALKGENGKKLASRIREQYPFAMIDEFQDTSSVQYDSFHRIFITEKEEGRGFIMIGDPKQSIYKFRGADIFSYLAAKQNAQEIVTLNKNWRTVPALVKGVNRLFSFEQQDHFPFVNKDIPFNPVESRDDLNVTLGEQKNQRYFLQENYNEELAAKQCAYLIQQQLKLAEQGKISLFKNNESVAIKAEDIAILIRNRDQAKLIKSALAQYKIRSVIDGERQSVFKEMEAKDLLLVLKACIAPNDQRAVLAAIGSSLWQLSARQLYQIKNDERDWDNIVNDFINYKNIWQKQGILPMLHHIFLEQNIIQRMRVNQNADRRITNLLHLAELLQEATPNLENETALVHWLSNQIETKCVDDLDKMRLRLESEDKLIKIQTIHGSKGLEYPIVWLPFVGKNYSNVRNGASLTLYRDDDNQLKWQFGKIDSIKDRLNKEEQAEELRQLYVAMTRAKYQMNIILPNDFDSTSNSNNSSKSSPTGNWNTMRYLLTNGNIKDKRTTKEYLEHKLSGVDYSIDELSNDIPQDDWTPSAIIYPELNVSEFNQIIKQKGLITNFTKLNEISGKYHSQKESLFNDLAKDDDRAALLPERIDDELSDNLTAHTLPSGKRVGIALHSFLEHCHFSEPIQPKAIEAICEQLELDKEEWLNPLITWFNKVLVTPFGEQEISLSQIKENERLNELKFHLRLTNNKALIELNNLFKQYSPLAKKLPDLLFFELEGFVKGFIDCVVRVNGKYYILDYKSNYLGSSQQYYSADNLFKAMGQNRYDLQFLLYTLAVHRYLKTRLGEDYDYTRDFGGIAYLFLRGMNGELNQGVYFEKPDKDLIEEMDNLFN